MREEDGRAPTWLDLYDWRCRVSEMYRDRERALRAGEDEQVALQRFRAQKDRLFKRHPQSPLSREQREAFIGLSYFPYDASLRVEAELEPVTDEEPESLGASGPHTMRFRRAGNLRFAVQHIGLRLAVYWIDVYGGGLFLPFRDSTSGQESYEGGRYLFDTVKGSDFMQVGASSEQDYGYSGGLIILDFNYAYNPSCAYDPRWVCPLAPRRNRLPLAIRAGEMRFEE